MSEHIPRENIRAHALAAAEAGKGPEACPYSLGSDPEYEWKDTFYLAVARQMEASE